MPGALNRVLIRLFRVGRDRHLVTDVPSEYRIAVSAVSCEAGCRADRTRCGSAGRRIRQALARCAGERPGTAGTEPGRLAEGYSISVFKLADASLRFVFLTGVTKFSQVSVFSGFNQPKDISMFDKYEALLWYHGRRAAYPVCGSLYGKWQHRKAVTEEEMRQQLKHHYDGYHFSKG